MITGARVAVGRYDRPMIWAALSVCILAGSGEPADLVVENARIWSDGLEGLAEFAAVRDGRFVHIGAAEDDLIGPSTERVDAQGRVVIPGLIDAHAHMLSGGLEATRISLREAGSREEFVERIDAWVRGLEPGEWVLGGRWSTESWLDPAQPTRAWVDQVAGDHPLYLTRMDGHSALANSKALGLASITRDGPPDPAGGVIERDPATGEPTGVLRDSAMDLVARHIPPPTSQNKLRALRHAVRVALRYGITAVSDIVPPDDLPVYEQLARDNPGVRFFIYVSASDWAKARDAAAGFRGRAGWVEIRGFKAYMDGSLGSRTAYMREPYRGNDPSRRGWRGLLIEDAAPGRLDRNLEVARDTGLQSIVHAIGDEANHLLLDALERVYRDLPAARCRSEHAQHLRPEDIPRFAALGVIASMQPYHKADDARYCESYIGPQRSRTSYAYRSLLDAGVVVAFGSDWPVVTSNPYLGLEAAVTGRTLDGAAWQTQENITVTEALRCYTSRAAYAVFADHQLGRIAPGFRADFVILERSPFDDQVSWRLMRPERVYVDGRLAHPLRPRREPPGPP
jgi:predicted amidohydrolase YtcJ